MLWQLGSWLLCSSCNGSQGGENISAMSSNQALLKAGRHFNSFEKWPMSSSYPQDSGQKEYRYMAKAMKEKMDTQRRETIVNVENNQDNCYESFRNFFKNIIIGGEESTDKDAEDVDEVDGRTEDILKPIVKLYFLKIIFVDIGISLGDLVTDIAQGFNLIFDNNWNIHWSTFHYGCIVLAFIWIPAIPMLLHVATSKTLKYFSDSENFLTTLLHVLIFVIFFPLLPTLMYARILFLRRSYSTNRDKLKFMEFEQKTTELKSIVGSIESTLQFTLMLWMMSRGILQVPWNQKLSSSCVEDSLGRVACLPSIPMLSLSFSLLSILKSAFDMNMVPYVSSSVNSVTKSKLCQHIVLCFFPFFLCTILFRLSAYAFILTFIDYWSIIPAVILYIIHLGICGVFFIKQEDKDIDDNLPMDNIMSASTGTINQANTDDEGNTEEISGPPKGLVWNGDEWMSKSCVEGEIKQRCLKSESPLQNGTSNEDGNENEIELDVASFVNENNTPLLINSVAGFFFPCVHSTVSYHDAGSSTLSAQPNCLQFLEKLLAWQMKVIMAQVMIFNLAILIVLTVISILVTFVHSFNYKTNIFNFLWFSIIISFLFIFGITGILWTFKICPNQSWEEKEENMIQKPPEQMRRRHVTGDSNTASIYSATNSMINRDQNGPGKIKEKSLYCIFTSLLVLLPLFVMILSYKLIPVHKIYMVQLHQDDQRFSASVIGSYDSSGFEQYRDTILDPDHFVFVNNTGIDFIEDQDGKVTIIIDARPEHLWRVSSPRTQTFNSGQMLMVRGVDMRRSDVNPSMSMLLTKDIDGIQFKLQDFMQCSKNPKIQINQNEEFEERNKYLFSNGSVMEFFDVVIDCQDSGHPCSINGDGDDAEHQVRVGVQCNEQLAGPISFQDQDHNLEASEAQIINGKMSSYCCFNSSHTIRFYGDQCDNLQFEYLDRICNFSNYFLEGPCNSLEMQLKTQVCNIHGSNCALTRSFMSPFSGEKPFETCILNNCL